MTEQVPPSAVEDESREHVSSEQAGSHDAEPVVQGSDSEESPVSGEGTPRTGVASVDAVLGDLERLDTLPPEEQVGAFERAHEALRSALDVAPESPVAGPGTGIDQRPPGDV
jgi:hypothetical protein